MTSPKILDNSSVEFQLKTFLKEHLKSASFTQVSIATGYWDLPAMVEVYDELVEFLKEG